MNFDEAMRQLAGMPEKINRVLRNTILRATKKVADESRLNAPKSPTQAEIDAARTAKFGKKHTARVKRRRPKMRKANASSRPMPGGLVQSIDYDMTESAREIVGSVFVSGNSKAGQYAAIIHDAKGKAWFDRGVGTVRKGARADDKFIERALKSSEPNTFRILENEVTKALGAR